MTIQPVLYFIICLSNYLTYNIICKRLLMVLNRHARKRVTEARKMTVSSDKEKRKPNESQIQITLRRVFRERRMSNFH